MIEQIVNRTIEEMQWRSQNELRDVLYGILSEYEISERKNMIAGINDGWKNELAVFLARKRLEGRTEGTVKQYEIHLSHAFSYINKPIRKITETDLTMYLLMYKKQRNVSDAYLDNIRRVFTSFFGWMQRKGYIESNPADGIDEIKAESKIKKPLSDVELEILRRNCETKRDIALLEFLYSTGVRVSELISLDRNDVDFSRMEVVVYGKGRKEREVYLTPTACMYLDEYIRARIDRESALFVTLRSPYKRMGRDGIEARIREIGERAGVKNVHPHRFRRTMATNILSKGMPIEEVRQILGHSKLDTTMIYCDINKENVKHHHKKYMSA